MKESSLTDDEKRALRAAKIARLGYWDTDFDNNILYHSGEFLTVHGLPLDKPIRRQEEIYKLIHADDLERVRLYFETVDREALDYDLEYRIVRPNGDVAYIREIGEVVYDDAGAPIGHTGTSQDITEESVIQHRLRIALSAAEETLRSKDAFLANMSHELRTPLNAISGYAELLAMRDQLAVSDEKAETYVKAILQSSDHLKSIIGDILLQVEMGQRTFELDVDEISIKPFLQEIANISGLTLDQNSSVIVISIDPENATAVFDKRLIGQVLINMIGNAVKYAGTEEGLEIGYRSEEGMFRFFVQDQGPGMPPEELLLATTAFFRGANAKRAAIPGTGLGLSLSDQIMRLHGGFIELHSEPGEGLRVEMVFPKIDKET